jgi:predicted nuclease of predicted toxin-antitoxin system
VNLVADVLQIANELKAVLLTADKDFGELVFRQHRVAHGVVLIRLAGLAINTKANLVATALRDHGPEMPGAFSVVSPNAVRASHRLTEPRPNERTSRGSIANTVR